MLSMSSSSDKPMQTIIIPLFQGMEALHILRTDIFKALAARTDIRVVLLVVGIVDREREWTSHLGVRRFKALRETLRDLSQWLGKLG